MAFTFGAATADDITAAAAQASGSASGVSLYAGWWYPTTLTATRGYCSSGNIYGMEVNTATDELRFRSDNTTDGQWTTTGADITTNKWWFIAFLSTHHNTGPTGAWRCWVGTAESPPVEVTVTSAVAPVGNHTGNATRYVGNKGTGTLSFQGDIGWMSAIVCSNVGINCPLGVATAGTITNDEAALNLNRWVIPLWLGTPDLRKASHNTYANAFSVMHFPLGNGRVVYQWSHNPAIAAVIAPTINGATLSGGLPPRAPPNNWPLMYPRARRAA